MSHLPSTTAIARTLLLAGILLAVTVLAARMFFPAFAQETNTVEYDENSTSSVAVYTATDPEGQTVTWELNDTTDGSGHADAFSIDGGVLTFKNAPDFENPTFTNSLGDTVAVATNGYQVTVQATGGSETETEEVVVKVIDLEEPGILNLMTGQPKVGALISPTLTDGDGRIDGNGDREDPLVTKLDGAPEYAEWQWATSTSAEGPWSDIKPSEDTTDNTHDGDDRLYQPRESDIGSYLRVTATYVDGHGKDDPFTDGIDESMDSVSMVSANPVIAADYKNQRPKFKDLNPDMDGVPARRDV